MKITLYLYYFFRSVILRGLFNTLRLLKAEVDCERKFEIKTSMIKESGSSEFFHYQGASYQVLLRIFSEIGAETKDLDFTDIGCGKGRVVFVAEYSGYNHITGIELDEELVENAEENLMRYPFKRQESKIEFRHVNALQYVYKNTPTLYFLFNPFNQEILEKVLDRIEGYSRSETWFVYMNPKYPEPFRKRGIKCIKAIKTRFYMEALVFKKEAWDEKITTAHKASLACF